MPQTRKKCKSCFLFVETNFVQILGRSSANFKVIDGNTAETTRLRSESWPTISLGHKTIERLYICLIVLKIWYLDSVYS